MLSLISLTKSFAGKVLFSDLTLHIKNSERVGLIGINGSGKTTLLKIIKGLMSVENGKVLYPKNTTIGYLPQDLVQQKGSTLIEETLSGFPQLQKIRNDLKVLEAKTTQTTEEAEKYAIINNNYNELGGFAREYEAKEILRGLGFNENDLERSIEEFSGGWQRRIVLSHILLMKPDIILLDEPTNQLDMETLDWLENFLSQFNGIILAVTHDRYFLNRFTKRICELSSGKITNYYGTYEDFLFEKSQTKETTRKKYFAQKKRIAEIQYFIDKFRARKDMRKQVRTRKTMLKRMDMVKLPKETKTMNFSFPQPKRSGKEVINLINITKSFDSSILVDNIDLTIERGDKIGLVGPNGIGKSTLLRIIAGIERVDRGEVKYGYNVSFQLFSQEDLTLEAEGETVLSETRLTAPEFDISNLRTYLAAFLFSGDAVEKRIEVLSGGEKNRLKLAKMLLKPANFLLLDEPSGHLDIQGKEILEEALSQFSGTIVLISHDRFMLNRVCNKTITIENKKLHLYLGDYSYYLEKKKSSEDTKPESKTQKPKEELKYRKRLQAEKRQEIYSKKIHIEKLEGSIIAKEKEVEEKEKLMLIPETFKDGAVIKQTLTEIDGLRSELEKLYFDVGEAYKILDWLNLELSGLKKLKNGFGDQKQ